MASNPPKKGRPQTVSDEQIRDLLAKHATGVPLHQCLRESTLGVTYRAIKERIEKSEALTIQYANSRADYADAKVSQMYDYAMNEPEIPRARLLCDIVKWEVAKVLPKLYGDRLQATDADGNQLSIVINKLV